MIRTDIRFCSGIAMALFAWGCAVTHNPDAVAPPPTGKPSPNETAPSSVTRPQEPEVDQTVLCSYVRKPEKSGFLQSQSFVTAWYVLGPFQYQPATPSTDDVLIQHPFVNEEKLLDFSVKPRHLLKAAAANPVGGVNIARTGGNSYSAAYAVTCIYAEHEMSDLILYSGSDDFIKIWINGKLVHSFTRNRTGQWDQDKVRGIKLRQGLNLVVVKTVTHNPDWRFFFRLADSDGAPMEFALLPKPGKAVSSLIAHLKSEN